VRAMCESILGFLDNGYRIEMWIKNDSNGRSDRTLSYKSPSVVGGAQVSQVVEVLLEQSSNLLQDSLIAPDSKAGQFC